ncbi:MULTISPECIES: amidohydrolase family protein [Achromobacter]|uniref:Amidohydrolase family protein n=1 Tax=Achromobacter spanius TaxID=217203 RepID=A0ABY8H156_9BURK|nr:MULTISPECIES: amidohydrolase family protein [Achromobacter]WAI85719.1 amidohydrolase family protein [Achromobacter spanius]WEX95799.1 amidohydrolase family protein [Achromobacter sp. SS2-2022]WFP10479.1 amidohydrolase family protein [Achromobacter spanius]
MPAPDWPSLRMTSFSVSKKDCDICDIGLFTLEQAVHKMTGKPASYFRLPRRGHIAAGHAADLVVFDADTIADKATWASPTRQAQGIDYVLVNGNVAWRAGEGTGARSGKVIRGDVDRASTSLVARR